MIKSKDDIKKIYQTEKQFWEKISEENDVEGYKRWKPKAGICLREADKIVIEKKLDSDLNEVLLREKPKRLVVSPEYAIFTDKTRILGIEKVSLLGTFENITFRQDPFACLYLFAKKLPKANDLTNDLQIRDMDSSSINDMQIIFDLRTIKDKDEDNEAVRLSLQTWIERRLKEIPGYKTFVLFENGVPIGNISCYQHNKLLTRIRDTFITEDKQGKGYMKYLLGAVKNEFKGPYAVVTDTHNEAIFKYKRYGFKPIFIQEAYELIKYPRANV